MEAIFILIVILIIGIGVASKMTDLAKKPNKGDLFACANCGKQTKHDTRTLRGFDAGVRKSFRCWECFKEEKNRSIQVGNRSGAGCATVVVIFAITFSVSGYGIIKFIA